jgi:S1-C subfamily serine protease
MKFGFRVKIFDRNKLSRFKTAAGPQYCIGFIIGLVVVMSQFQDIALATQDVRDAMVKIYAYQREPYYYDPWSMNRETSSSGSGCLIEGNRILTNAHVISDLSYVEVLRYGEPRKFNARIIAVSHAADLALLTVDDPTFFAGVKPLALGKLPEVQQEVYVYGFPEGGDTLSITKGVVSRIEHDSYIHSSRSFLAVQIDAAINSGNSGGPVLIGDRISGVVMQYLEQSENIGYMVPMPIVKHFLTDLEDGRHDGFPEHGILVQSIENQGLRKMYRLTQQQTGILVVAVLPGSAADGKILRGDVILAIDGHNIADDGTVEFRPKERTSADYYTHLHQMGETLELDVLRDGHERKVQISLNKPVGFSDLVPRERYDVRPTYFIYGGLIFIPLTQNYLMAWGEDWYSNAPRHLVALYQQGRQTVEGEQVVILSKTLPAEVNSGYHKINNQHITKVNGFKIHNLRELIRIVERKSNSPFVVFESRQGLKIVLERKRAESELAKILKRHSIPADRSGDLR